MENCFVVISNLFRAVSFLKSTEELVSEKRIKIISKEFPSKIICKVQWVELDITKAISIQSDITPEGFITFFIERVALSKSVCSGTTFFHSTVLTQNVVSLKG